jgi:hypothetical protein
VNLASLLDANNIVDFADERARTASEIEVTWSNPFELSHLLFMEPSIIG